MTYTSYKEHYALYTKIQGSIAVNSCQVGLAQKYIILLSNATLIVYKTSKCTIIKNTEFISFTLSEGTYSIDEFNAKIKVATLQQRKGLQPPQIKDLRLVIPKDYLFMADNTIFYALATTLKRLRSSDQPYPLVLIKHPLIHHLHQKFCHYAVSKSTKLRTSQMGSHQVC